MGIADVEVRDGNEVLLSYSDVDIVQLMKLAVCSIALVLCGKTVISMLYVVIQGGLYVL